MVYDTFGNMYTDSGSVAADYVSYTGREAERDLGIYYYRARYYDPLTGRFMVRDPLGLSAGDVNLYKYVGNNPANLNDPFGLYSFTEFGYDMADFWVGVGDGASFGLTSWIRSQSWYGDSYVNTCSGWYTGGQITGRVASAAIGAAGAVRAGAALGPALGRGISAAYNFSGYYIGMGTYVFNNLRLRIRYQRGTHHDFGGVFGRAAHIQYHINVAGWSGSGQAHRWLYGHIPFFRLPRF